LPCVLTECQENLNILRDAAQLQTQLRIYDGLVETRHTLLKIRPAMRQHWIALAVAYHLNGNLPEAKKVLELYESTLKVSARRIFAVHYLK
jgi:peptide alpha-N-acetyltransferase